MLLLPILALLVKMSDTKENGKKISLVVVVSSKSVAPSDKTRVTFDFYYTGWGKKISHFLNFYYGNAVAVIRLV